MPDGAFGLELLQSGVRVRVCGAILDYVWLHVVVELDPAGLGYVGGFVKDKVCVRVVEVEGSIVDLAGAVGVDGSRRQDFGESFGQDILGFSESFGLGSLGGCSRHDRSARGTEKEDGSSLDVGTVLLYCCWGWRGIDLRVAKMNVMMEKIQEEKWSQIYRHAYEVQRSLHKSGIVLTTMHNNNNLHPTIKRDLFLLCRCAQCTLRVSSPLLLTSNCPLNAFVTAHRKPTQFLSRRRSSSVSEERRLSLQLYMTLPSFLTAYPRRPL